MFKYTDDVGTVLVDPCSIVLSDHVRTGVAHLLCNPVNRGNARGKQLAGISVSALARSAITNACRFQMRFEEPVPYDEVADVRQAAFGVQEYKVQLVLANGLVIALDDVDRVHSLELVDGVQFAQGIPGGLQQAYLARRAPGFGHPIGAPAPWTGEKSPCPVSDRRPPRPVQ